MHPWKLFWNHWDWHFPSSADHIHGNGLLPLNENWISVDDSRPVTNMLSMRAHLPEHCTDIAEVMGSNPVKGSFFSRRYYHCCSGNVHYCEDCFIITSSSAVHMYNFHLFTVIYTSNVVKHDNTSNLNTSIDQYHYNKLLGHTPSANWMFEPSQLLCFFVLLDNNHSFPR